MVESRSCLWTGFESCPFSLVDTTSSSHEACLTTLREVIRRLPDVINSREIRVLMVSGGFESRPIRSTKF